MIQVSKVQKFDWGLPAREFIISGNLYYIDELSELSELNKIFKKLDKYFFVQNIQSIWMI